MRVSEDDVATSAERGICGTLFVHKASKGLGQVHLEDSRSAGGWRHVGREEVLGRDQGSGGSLAD